MTLHDYIRVLRKGWVLILIGVLLGVALAGIQTVLATPKYESTTKVFVSVQISDTPSIGDLNSSNSYAQQKIKSYVDIVNSPVVLTPVIQKLGLTTTPAALANDVSADTNSGTVLIEITATSSSAQAATNIANATASSLQTVVVDQLERPSSGGPSLVSMQTVQPAVPASQPSSPNPALNLLVGAAVGFIIGVAAAVLRGALDTRVHGRHDVEALADGTPIIGGIALDPDFAKQPLVVYADSRSPRAESFRSLRTNLRFVNVDGASRAFVVTSAVPGEGKSTTAANLALALAEAGERVVLIDGDLRLPKLAEYLGIEGSVGLTDVLIGRVALGDVLQRWGSRDLFVLPAGQIPPNPSELLGSSAMLTILNALSEQVDYVLIDAPPLLPVTDAAIIATMTAGAILVTATGKVKRSELAAAIRSVSQTGGRIVGFVMTMIPTRGPDAYGSSYYSYYGGEAARQESQVKARRASRAAT